MRPRDDGSRPHAGRDSVAERHGPEHAVPCRRVRAPRGRVAEPDDTAARWSRRHRDGHRAERFAGARVRPPGAGMDPAGVGATRGGQQRPVHLRAGQLRSAIQLRREQRPSGHGNVAMWRRHCRIRLDAGRHTAAPGDDCDRPVAYGRVRASRERGAEPHDAGNRWPRGHRDGHRGERHDGAHLRPRSTGMDCAGDGAPRGG